jgi:prefoldin subunit 5
VPVAYYYYPSRAIPITQGNTSPNSTLGQSGSNFFGPVSDYNSFLDIIGYAGNSLVSGIQHTYESLAGVTEPSLPSIPQIASDDPIAGPATAEVGTSQIEGDVEQSDNSIVASGDSVKTDQEISHAVQSIRATLLELNTTLAQLPKSSSHSATSTLAISSAVKADSSSSPQVAQGAKIPESITKALQSAEEKVSKLESALMNGSTELERSNTRVKLLTEELNALNQRMQEVNQALKDPMISQADKDSLVGALVTNIELSLSDIEQSLEQAVADNQPKTVSEVLTQSVKNIFSELMNTLMQLIQLILSARL